MMKIVSLYIFIGSVNGFVVRNQHRYNFQKTTKQLLLHGSISDEDDKIIDVDFERIYGGKTVGSSGSTSSTDDNGTEKLNDDEEEEIEIGTNVDKTLFDLSYDSADPELRDIPIPFVDERRGNVGGETHIDGHLSFTVDLDGTCYGIAVPCDHCAAIVKENRKDNSVVNLSPDDDENEEIINIMAKHVNDQFNDDGDDIMLKRTPRILTISGNLTKYTENWESELFKNVAVEPETLLDDTGEDLDFFYDFMKSELGEKEFDKTKRQIRQQQQANGGKIDIEDELADLFKFPGMGTEEDDEEGLREIFDKFLDIDNIEDQYPDCIDPKKYKTPEGVALKLISFNMKNGMSYSLVKIDKPYVLVGKMVMNKINRNRVMDAEEEDYYRDNKMFSKELYFELLTPEEEKLIIPRLERKCQRDIEKAGLVSFQNN